MWAAVAETHKAAQVHHEVLPFLVAGITAAVLGGIEQATRLRSRFTLLNHAGFWWAGRLALEAGVAVIAILIVRRQDADLADNALTWIGAGAAGPAVMRLRVIDLESRPIGVATIYEPIRAFIEDHLDRRSAECLTTWLNNNILPRLLRVDPDPGALAQYALDFVKGRGMLTDADLAREDEWLMGVVSGAQPRSVMLELIARHITMELRGYRLLDRYLLEREEPPKKLLAKLHRWWRRGFG